MFGFEHDGYNLGNESQDDEDGGDIEPAGIEHIGVEDVGVVAAATGKEDVAQDQQDKAYNHDNIVGFAKYEGKSFLGVFGVFDFFCHNI